MVARSLPERLADALRRPRVGHYAELLLRLLGVSIPQGVMIGENLSLPHGAVGLVIHERTQIGDNVRLFQGVTLGRSDQYIPHGELPPGGRIVVGDEAVIGAGAVVLFKAGQEVTIGARSIIGANAVVLCDVPAGTIWAGNPARQIGHNPFASRESLIAGEPR